MLPSSAATQRSSCATVRSSCSPKTFIARRSLTPARRDAMLDAPLHGGARVRRWRRHGGWAGLAGALLLSLFVVSAPGAEPGYRELVLADAPAGYWRLGETAGSTAADASARALHGTYRSGVVLG